METLSREEMDTYSRQIVLQEIGYEGQVKLKNSRVVLLGIGGLGTPASLQLAAMGVGHLTIVDRDVVSKSDLHRQYLYDTASVGYPKVEVAAKRLTQLNPHIEVEPVAEPFKSYNAERIVRDADVVVDGLDTIETRYLVNRICVRLGVPYVFGAAIESYGNISTVMPEKTACLECFYPDIRDKDLPRCAIVGVLTPVLGLISSIQVSEAVRILLGQGPLLAGKLLYVDLKTMSFDELGVSRREECPTCGSKGREESIPRSPAVEVVCGRDGRGVFSISPYRELRLDLERLEKLVQNRGWKTSVRSRFSLSFDYDHQITMSIFEAGAGVAQLKPPATPDDTRRVVNIYRGILTDGLGVPPEVLPEAD